MSSEHDACVNRLLSLNACLVVFLSVSCGEEQPETSDGVTGSTSVAGSTTTGGEGEPNWQQAFGEQGVGLKCSQSRAEMLAAGAPNLSIGDTTLIVGFEQDGNNQDPVFARFDGDTQTYCQYHETEGPDGRALGLTWDGGAYAYVVYTIVGGGTALEGKGGWISSYAPGSISGGGPKVSVVGRVATATGTLESATFVIAVKSDNKVNSHSPRSAPKVLAGGDVEFLGASAHKPIDADMQSMDCTDYPFDSRYVFSEDLSRLTCAECTNCEAQMPCE